MTENWKPIKGYEGLYRVSDQGNIYNIKLQRPQKPHRDMFGYLKTSLSNYDLKQKIFIVHRVVAIAFIDNPENKKQVHHIDGNKENNHARNLMWVNPDEHGKPASEESKQRRKSTLNKNKQAQETLH